MAPEKTPGLAPPTVPFAARNQGTRGITRRLPEGHRPQAGHKGRFVPRSAESRPQRRAAGGPPRALGAGARGLGQQTGKAVYTGKEGSSSARERTRGGLQPRRAACRVTHATRKPLAGPNPGGSPTWECSEEALHPQTPPPAPAHASRDKVSFCTEGGAAYLGVWAQARRARRGRRTGAPGPAAWWGRPASAAAQMADCAGTCVPSWSARAGGCSRMPRARPGLTAPGAGREAVAAALARALPPPSLPQRSQLSPGAAAALARRPGRLECRRSGRPGQAALPGEGLAPRYGRNFNSGTHPALRLPRAPAHSALRLRPFPSSLRPARLHFPPSFLLPFSPLPGPRPAATRSVYGEAGRGGASSGPGQLRLARGPAQDKRPRAPRWKSLPAHLGWGFEIGGYGLAGLSQQLGATGRGRGTLHQGLL